MLAEHAQLTRGTSASGLSLCRGQVTCAVALQHVLHIDLALVSAIGKILLTIPSSQSSAMRENCWRH